MSGFIKIAMHLEGAEHVRDTFRVLPTHVGREVAKAVRATIDAVERGAKMRVPVSAGGRTSRKGKGRPGPGELRATIRGEVSESSDGTVGYVKAGYGKLPRRLKGKATNKRTKEAAAQRKSRRPRRSGVSGDTSSFFAQFFTKENQTAHATRNALGVYAMTVEYGSPRQHKPAKPYLRPALEAEKPRHAQRMQAALARAVEASTRGRGAVA